MARENKTPNEEPVSSEKYDLSDEVRLQGYSATVDGRDFLIDFEKDFQGNQKDEFASCGTMEDSPKGKRFKSSGETFLSDLTDKQLWILTHARVIKLNAEQSKLFGVKFYNKQN